MELPVMDKPQSDALGVEADEISATTAKRRKRLLYGISSSILREMPEDARRKIDENMELFDSYQEKIEVTVVHFPEERIVSANEYDAYYGDPMPVMMEFVQAGKPVMIQNVNSNAH